MTLVKLWSNVPFLEISYCETACCIGSLLVTTLSRFLVHDTLRFLYSVFLLSCVVFPCFTASSAPASAPTHYPASGDP